MPDRATPPPRTQQLIVTLYGLYARDRAQALPVASLIRLLGDLGVDAARTRSSVSRLKRRGVLEPVAGHGTAAYRLSEELEEVFVHGDHRIFDATPNLDTRWLLVAYSVPEKERHLRHRIRDVLSRLGFGAVAPGLGIARDDVEPDVRRALQQAGALDHVHLFTTSSMDDDRLRRHADEWWDLDAVDAGYAAFLEQHAHLTDREGAVRYAGMSPDAPPSHSADADVAAFAAYVPALTHWRRLPYVDPLLPRAALPHHWHGDDARALFATLHRRLSGPAERHARSFIP